MTKMILAVFHEFAHPEVLEEVRRFDWCEVDVAKEATSMAASPTEQAVTRTNAKLITIRHNIAARRDAFDSMTEESFAELNKTVDGHLDELVKLGFVVENRHPVTSAGCPMVDRVILSFPE